MSRVVLLFTLLVLGCSSGSATPYEDVPGLEVAVDAGPRCEPVGSMRSCACPVVGAYEVCQPSGAWSECFCPPPDAGAPAPDVAVVDAPAPRDAVAVDVLDAAVGEDRAPPPDAHDAAAVDAADAAVELDVVAVADARADAADVPVDTGPPPCTADTYRCDTLAGSPYLYRCVAGSWQPLRGCGGYIMSSNRTGYCSTAEPTCRFCAGRDCTPMCAEDLDCLSLGLGRCDRGQCLHRGAVACRTLDDCDAIGGGRVRVDCVSTAFFGSTEMLCAGSSWCTFDGMCPAGWRCDRTNGHCAR